LNHRSGHSSVRGRNQSAAMTSNPGVRSERLPDGLDVNAARAFRRSGPPPAPRRTGQRSAADGVPQHALRLGSTRRRSDWTPPFASPTQPKSAERVGWKHGVVIQRWRFGSPDGPAGTDPTYIEGADQQPAWSRRYRRKWPTSGRRKTAAQSTFGTDAGPPADQLEIGRERNSHHPRLPGGHRITPPPRPTASRPLGPHLTRSEMRMPASRHQPPRDNLSPPGPVPRGGLTSVLG